MLSFPYEVKERVAVEIFDGMGQLRLTRQVNNPGSNISLQHKLTPGIYIVVVKTGNARRSKKLIVVK
jgi:hypothetical protein